MRSIYSAISALALSWVLAAPGYADSYDYEFGISYDGTRASSETVFAVSPGPFSPAEPIVFETDSDTDEIGFAGSWFFDGVAASTGPRTRAAFISRASSVSLQYTRGDGDIVLSSSRTEQSTNNFAANLRWVWSESGWYGLAGASRADAETAYRVGSMALDAASYSLGFGRYIGSQTTLELRAVRQDSDVSTVTIVSGTGAIFAEESTSTEAAVAFSHIGSLGRTWQYGTDITLATTPRAGSEGSYGARLSLYPSRPLAFGFEVDGALQSPSYVSTNYGLFASWFPRERIELVARYGWSTRDDVGNTDFDQYDFGLGVNVRF